MAFPSHESEEGVHSVHYIRRLKLDSDQRALAEMEAQVADLTLAEATIQTKISDLASSLEVTQRSLETAKARRDGLLTDVHEQCASLRAIELFPEELLCAIFERCAFDGAHDWENGPVVSNRLRARAPFACAAVCRRWRRAAVSSPAHWHYVAVPQLTQSTSDGIRFLAYAQLVLSRSGSVPLIIVFDMIDHAGSRHHAKILEVLSQQLQRWRVFSAMLAEQRALSTLLECLRGPAPTLCTVCVAVRPAEARQLVPFDPPAGNARPRYLCHAPQLDHLWIENLPFSWRRGHETMGALTRLVLIQRQLGDTFWATLATAAGALERLIVYAKDIPANAPDSSIRLPNLTSLSLGVGAWKLLERFPHNLKVPALNTLSLHAGRPVEMVTFLRQLTSLTSLTLCAAAISDEDFPALRHLVSLSHLTLVAGTVTTSLFECIRQDSEAECMWPALTALEFTDAALRPANGDALVELVRVRRVAGADVRWRRIERVVFEGNHNVPRWDVAEIDHILSHP